MQESSRDQNSAPPSPQSLSSAWDKVAEAAALTTALDSVRINIARLNDPYLGAVGLDFLRRMTRTACAHIPVQDLSCMAAYQSFIYPPNPMTTGFNNHIAYGPSARTNSQLLFSAHIHEGLHALQKASAPALHASPYNPMTRIILCPRDWVTAQERCEQDAYVKQAWMNSLLAMHDASVFHTSRPDPMNVSMFASTRLTYGNIFATLHQAAKTVMNRNFFVHTPDNGEPAITFGDHYHTLALDNYKRIIEARVKNDGHNIVFVRMDADDILAIGHSFGPNPFARKNQMQCAQDFARPSRLSSDNKVALRDLNMDLGIVDDRSLPTLREALESIGLSREQFLARTYTGFAGYRGMITPPPKSPAP
ncbi:hypothetical protein [Micavibrio aeruginosavorus]|uniref:hypothetical protein n=1 Tax=Micavibrio aeruginosavorus TaxID=349221 RepID=UPI003F4AA857